MLVGCYSYDKNRLDYPWKNSLFQLPIFLIKYLLYVSETTILVVLNETRQKWERSKF